MAVLDLCCFAWAFSLVAESPGYFLVAVPRLLLLLSINSRAHGLSSCSSPALEHWLNCCLTSLDASWHMEYSMTRDKTGVSCIGRWISYHWATREAQTCYEKTLREKLREQETYSRRSKKYHIIKLKLNNQNLELEIEEVNVKKKKSPLSI